MNTPRNNTARPIAALNVLVKTMGLTDVGREREHNEDSMLMDDQLGLYMICDGMGGHIDGQLASQLAVQTVAKTFRDLECSDSETEPRAEPLIRSIENANAAIFEYAQHHPASRGMGTTAVGIRFDNDQLHICHVGDSRVYRLRGTALQLLTRDHSLANLYADNPELDGKLGPSTSNVIVRAVGLDTHVVVDHRIIAVEEDDLFLLCCDGLNDLLNDQQIGDILRSDLDLEQTAKALVDTANRLGGIDNITVILVSVIGTHTEFNKTDKTTLGF